MKDGIIEGTWWIHGPDHPAHFGTLHWTDGDELRLTVKVPQNVPPNDILRAFAKEELTPPVPERILGEDTTGAPITLFGCFPSHSVSARLATYSVHVMAAVQGLKLESWTHRSIHAVRLKIDLLHGWLGDKILEPVQLPDRQDVWAATSEPDLVFELVDDVRLRIVRFVATSQSADEYKLWASPWIWLHFGKSQSLDDLSSNWFPWVTRLFSLLAGTAAHYEELECYVEDPYAEDAGGIPNEGKLIRSPRKTKPLSDVYTHSMLAPYPDLAASMPQILKNWYATASRLEPVVDLFSTVTFHRSLHCEAQFLFLVQALEVYHARSFTSAALPTEQHRARVKAILGTTPAEFRDWARLKLQGANFKHLDERLSEIFERHPNEAQRLFEGLATLPEKIRYTRNYLTHYTGDLDSAKYMRLPEMVEVNWGLRTLLWICLLKEIGVSGSPIERLIRRNTNVRFVNLA